MLIKTESTAHRKPPTMNDTAASRYVQPSFFDRHVFNPLLRGLTRVGISVMGTRILVVPGRTSGQPRSTVVNLLTVDGVRYLVAPRGETKWVRNLRAAGGTATLQLGRRREPIAATELPDHEKTPILRAYLREWAWEVGKFFEGLEADSPDADLDAASSGFPVFRLD